MIRIGILGDIGSGKTYVAKSFGYPVFNADEEVARLYNKDREIYKKLRKKLPKYFNSFPVNKKNVSQAILNNKKNLKKIIKVVHSGVRKKMYLFLKKNKSKKFVILDIPLLLENKINKKNDVLIFVKANKTDIDKRLKRRKNFNPHLIKKFREMQLSLDYKRRKAQFIIENKFTKKSVKVSIKLFKKNLQNERSSIRY
tara:strand:+ start:4894 stop:5487 length:594 start_codon:yes stop_codon:yes gene_type:complete